MEGVTGMMTWLSHVPGCSRGGLYGPENIDFRFVSQLRLQHPSYICACPCAHHSGAPPPSLTSPGPLPAAASCLHVHHHTLGLRAARRRQQHRAPLPQLGLAEGVVGPRGVSAGGRWQGVNEMDRGCEWSVGVGARCERDVGGKM